MTLPLLSLRELEEHMKLALATLGAARRALDDGRSTSAAVELDRIDLALGLGRELVHDLLEGEGHAVERALDLRRARLSALLRAWSDDAAKACAAKGVALVPPPTPEAHVELDAPKVRRLLHHLVSAALARGKGQLELRCALLPAGPTRVSLRFEAIRRPTPRPFERDSPDLRVQRLAAVLGGGYERTPVEDGAALSFAASIPARLLAPEAAAEPVRLEGARVLVVEDDDDARAALGLLLEDCGLEVVTAGTYDEALARFQRGTFRLGLLDVDLNGRSGVELHRELRAREGAPFPAIFLSGSDRPLLVDAPSVRFLVKPVDVTRLESSIRELLEVRLVVGA